MKNESGPVAKTRVVLVDDHPLVREHLGRLLNQQDNLVVVGECSEAEKCLELLRRVPADLAIVDLSLEKSHGLDLLKDLRLQFPKLPVVVLSMHDEVAYAEAAVRAGARGYVTKHEATHVILVAIKHVLAGEIFVLEKLAGQLVGLLLQGHPPVAGVKAGVRMSDRELQIFELIGRGCPTREIAAVLKIGTKTVETHYANLKDKFGATTMAELRAVAGQWAQRTGSA